jgi:hydroxymethylpyrimidine pyrophosphatase-like HAD family hydrolase
MVIYCDIDGTLTTAPENGWGPLCPKVISGVKEAIEAGHEVILWSGRGKRYAEAFAEKHDLKVVCCLSKPDMIIDDNHDIRPKNRLWRLSPADVKSGLLRKALKLG